MTEPGIGVGPGALQRYARQASRARDAALERCELCSEVIPSEHRHLLVRATRELLCVCRACSILFDREGAADRKYRLIPVRRLFLPDFQLDDADWRELRIPVGMAFFLRDAPEGPVVAYFPSPAGPTEAHLQPETWEQVEASNPVLRDLQPEVEALLVNRARGARDHFLVPIDECYRLVGILRTHWRGLAGGAAVWTELEHYFASLKARSGMPALSRRQGDAR